MKNDPTTARIWLVKCLLGIGLLFAGLTFLQGYQWLGKTFPGFTLADSGRITSLMHSQWTGSQSDLKVDDKILSFDDIAFESKTQLFDYIAQQEYLFPIKYQISRNDQTITKLVYPMIFTMDDYLVSFLSDLIIGLGFLIVAAVLFFLSPGLYGNFTLFLAGFSIGLMQILATDYYTNRQFLGLFFMNFFFFSLVVTHVHFDLFKSRSLLKIPPRFFNIAVAGVTASAGLAYWLFISHIESVKVFSIVAMASFAIPFLIGHSNCTYIYLTSHSALTRRIIRVFNLLFIAIIPSYTYYVCREFFDILLPREFVLFQLAYILLLPLAIIRFHAADFNIHLSRKNLFSIIGLTFLNALLLIFLMVPAIFRIYDFSQEYTHATLFGATLVAIAFVLYANHSRLFDRLFFYSSFRFRHIIETVCDNILSQLSVKDILSSLRSCLKNDLKIDTFHFYLNQNDQSNFLLQEDENNEAQTSLLPYQISRHKVSYTKPLALTDLSYDARNPMQKFLQDHHLSLLIPVQFNNKVIALAFFGPKNDNTPFSAEDISNLDTILKATATALTNARQYHSVVQLEERLKVENNLLNEQIIGRKKGEAIIGENGSLKEIFSFVEKLALSDGSVLIRGESGVGKELIARAIHERSKRSDKPFIAINCTAIPEQLLEAELFGYEKGAFTDARSQKIGLFEAADKGTLLLDEIGDLSLPLQSKLLRVLQEKEIKRLGSNKYISVDVRIISATNKNLKAQIAKKKFREDLYFRLNVFPLNIPPLRERKGDLRELTHHFIHKFSERQNKTILFPDKTNWERLKNYSWPGNIRELQNVIERAVVLTADGSFLTIHDLDDGSPTKKSFSFEKIIHLNNYHDQMAAFQRLIIQKALDKTQGNKTHAAQKLGIHPTHLYKMLKQFASSENKT